MPEGRSPISSARVSTGDIARHSFAIVRRGFDIDEVKTYLQTVARSIEVLEQREQELRDAVADADERAAHPIVDEATLTASLGQHSAQILRHAHDEAARIVVQAQEGASTLLREAQSRSDEMQEQSESSAAERVAEAELMVANARQEARVEVERIRQDAIADGEAVIARAKEEGRALLEQVQETRRRVMIDLAGRRRALSIQIEQLRAARDEMAASVQGVRGSIDVILQDLQRSDEDARAAASAAVEQARLQLPRPAPDDDGTATTESGETGEVPDGVEDMALGGTAPSVDELFARIRAGTDVPVAPATAPVPTAETGAEGATAPVAVVVEAPAEATEVDEEEEPAGPDDALIARRDELLAPVAAQLSRHVKRALGDDQNRLLDVLRSTPNLKGDALLGPEELHLSLFTTAAEGHIADAFAAGAVFGGADAGSIPADPAVEQAAAGLSRTVVTMLRRRIADGSDAGEEVGERVGAAFREWRGERIERLVGDFAVQAFSAGVAAAATPEGVVRWVMTSSSGCSDCDDNALAGPVPIAEGFPTGHAYPPAHSGCRCLVALVTP
jgi:cell division septum initiation protein DivIVA